MEFHLKVDPIVIKIDVNPQFTQTLAFLAAAFGYPAKTIANELKETAREIKAKAEAEKPKPKEPVKVWKADELQKYCLELATQKNLITINDVTNTLKRFKDNNGNNFQTIKELVEQKTPEEVNEFVRLINELAQVDIQKTSS